VLIDEGILRIHDCKCKLLAKVERTKS